MGVDYAVDLPCAPRTTFGTQAIVGMLKARKRADAVERMLRERGDDRPAHQLTFETVVNRPEGPVRETVTVQSLRDRASLLDTQSRHCEHCVARVHPEAYGCVGYVTYPLSVNAEKWLMARLPMDLDTTGGKMLRKAFNDFGWDGHYAEGLRTRGQTFFAGSAPQFRYWDDFSLSSDQIFDVLFGLGSLEPAHSQMLALFFGVIPHDISPFKLSKLTQDPASLADLANKRMAPVFGEHEQNASLRSFLRAVGIAAALNRRLLIDG